MSNEKIKAEIRSEFGKGAARRIRRENKIPAVVYAQGNEPIHVTLPGHETMMAIRHGGANTLLELEIDGKVQLALTKQIQVDPVRRLLEHVDFVAIVKGDKAIVDVQIVVVGDAEPGTMVVTDNNSVQVEAEATNIPESFEINIEGAEAGTQFLAGQLELPEGTTLLSDPELLIVNVTAEQEADLGETEDAEGDSAAAEGSEGGDAAEGGDSE